MSVVGKSHFYAIELANECSLEIENVDNFALTAIDFSVLHQLRSDLSSKMRRYAQVLTDNNLTVLGKPETN